MRDKRRAPSPSFASLAVLALGAALATLAPSCLPSLDPSLLTGSLCVGGVPDGILDPGSKSAGTLPEECDDGNSVDGDGCDSTCHVECDPPAVKDPHTLHCYSIVPTTSDDSEDCANLPLATTGDTKATTWLVTVRTNSERDVLRTLLDANGATDATFLAGYQLSLGQVLKLQTGTTDSAVAINGEPGILESTTAKSDFGCSGCYFGATAVPWPDQAAGDFVLLDASANFGTSATKPMQTICERVPRGDPPGCSVDCASPLTTTERRMRAPGATAASTYSYIGSTQTVDDAEATCASLGAGGHLLWLESEEERELVARVFAGDLQQHGATWVGVRRTNKVWAWSDGVNDGAGRPYFWAESSPKTNQPIADPATPLDCAALLTQVPGVASQNPAIAYGSGLISDYTCSGAAAVLPSLCKRPSP
jgi:cysteine-rich repeat protein